MDIDVNTDSLNDVLDRISASGAAVTASFDNNSQKVSLNSDNTHSQLILSGGATNFFSSVGISEGTYNSNSDLIEAPEVNVADVSERIVDSIVEENSEKPWEQDFGTPPTPVSAADAKMLGTMVHNIAGAMNTLFDDSAMKGSPGAFLEGIRSGIRSAVSTSFGSEGSQFKTDFGLNFDFSNKDGKVFNFSSEDQHRFETTLATQEGAASVGNTLFGNDSQGLFNQLHATLTESAAGFESQADPTGLFLDVSI
jgi:hypothetical protein